MGCIIGKHLRNDANREIGDPREEGMELSERGQWLR